MRGQLPGFSAQLRIAVRWAAFAWSDSAPGICRCRTSPVTTANPHITDSPPLSKTALIMIEVALAMGGFGIGIAEFATMGLMPSLASGLGVSEPMVGHLISVYALGVVIGAPLLAVIGSRLYRRNFLLGLMSFYALTNIASALAPGFESLLAFRFVSEIGRAHV